MDNSIDGGVLVPRAARFFPDLATRPIIDVSVGQEGELIKVFRDSLINRSPYFDSSTRPRRQGTGFS
ncbi:hypothetical protein XPA_010303 [Xanthoria parietina]